MLVKKLKEQDLCEKIMNHENSNEVMRILFMAHWCGNTYWWYDYSRCLHMPPGYRKAMADILKPWSPSTRMLRKTCILLAYICHGKAEGPPWPQSCSYEDNTRMRAVLDEICQREPKLSLYKAFLTFQQENPSDMQVLFAMLSRQNLLRYFLFSWRNEWKKTVKFADVIS